MPKGINQEASAIEERLKVDEAFLDREERYRILFEGAADAIFIMEDDRFIDCNPKALEMFQCSREQMIGQPPDRFSPPTQPDGRNSRENAMEKIAAALAGKPQLFEWRHCRYDGTTFDAEVSLTRLELPGMRMIHSIVRDVSRRKETERALEESMGKYRSIFENNIVGIFQSSPDGRFISVNPALARMCGYDSPEAMIEDITDIAKQHYVHPEERETFKRMMAERGYVESFEHETYRRDGSAFWVSVSSRAVRDINGSILYYEGTHTDITKSKQAEAALRASEERYRAIIENIDDGYYEVDLKGTIIFVNDAMLRLTGVSRSELEGANFASYASSEDAGMIFKTFHQVFLTGTSFRGVSWRVVRPDGREQHVEVSVSLIRDSAARPVGFRGILHDITERRKVEETIQHMAFHDALTGLPNRLLFYDRFSQILAHARRNREQFAVIMLDLDKFKDINDHLGHDAGDQLLRGVAERLTLQQRDGDTVARFGGDEFLLILPGIKQMEDLDPLGQKILQAFQQPFRISDHELNVHASIGIAVFPDDGPDKDTLFQKADFAMYRAKAAGGNRWMR